MKKRGFDKCINTYHNYIPWIFFTKYVFSSLLEHKHFLELGGDLTAPGAHHPNMARKPHAVFEFRQKKTTA